MIKNWKEFDLSEELYNESKEGEEKPSKETGFFSTLTFQVILCLAIAIILVLLNTFFPSQYRDIDSELKTLIQEDGGFAEDMEGIKGQFERWLNKEQATILPDVGESSTDTNSTEETISSVVSEDAASDTEDNVSSETAAAGGEPNGEAQIPIELPWRCIKMHADVHNLVLDPFAGLGSTLIACVQSGRRCRAIEAAPLRCDLIVRRWEQFTGEQAIRL